MSNQDLLKEKAKEVVVRKLGGKWVKKSGYNLCLSCDQIFQYKIELLDDPKVQRICNRCKKIIRNAEN